MHFPFADLIERHPRLQRAREVLSFADARARDVQMGQVAGSLTFTTLLSVVPLFAVALALFTAFPLFAQFRDELENFLLKVLPGQISSTVLRYVNEFAAQATRLTALGLGFLAFTALTMIITVDRVLNDIWRVRDRRPLAQRVMVYWMIISLGPVLIGASLSASSYLRCCRPNRCVSCRGCCATSSTTPRSCSAVSPTPRSTCSSPTATSRGATR